MTETSYTAWDDKLYQWPPPDGWYEAGDGKWWPEGYGPGPVGAEAAAETADPAQGSTDGASYDAAASDGFGAGQGAGATDGLIDRAADAGLGAAGGLGAAAGSGLSSASDALAGFSDGAESAVDAASDALPGSLSDALPGSLTDGGADALSSGRSAVEDRLGAGAGSAADALSGAGSDLAGGLPDALSDAGSGAAAGFTGGGSFADSLKDSVSDAVPDALSGAVPDGLSDAVPDALSGGVPDALSGAVPDALSDAVPDALSGGVPDALSDAVPDALSGGVPDALSGAVPDALSGAVPDGIGDAVPGFDAIGSPGDSTPGSLLGEAADRLGGAAPDLGGDVPVRDDVGAALAETMSARSDELSDPASSGIPGLDAVAGDPVGDAADAASTRAADAAAGASEFFTADIPASELGSLGDRPPTDLDALPPPSFDPPGAGGPLSSPAASASPGLDGLADLGEAAAGFAAPETDIDPIAGAGSGSLLGSSDDAPSVDPASFAAPTGFDNPGSGPSIGGFELPSDETMVPPASNPGPITGSGEVGGAAAAALGLPMAGEQGPLGGPPDETIVSPLAEPGGTGPNPAETGQFQPATGQGWDAPPGGQFGAPPPADGPGAMPWGQAGTPGGPPVAGGLDQAVLQDNRSGSSKTLLFVGLGVAALVLLGVLAFTLLGGSDDDSGGDATGPGSLAEPHARTTPVEIFYPTADAEQRFVVEVLEPVRDASALADGAPPADGQRFAVTRVRVANQSAADASVSDLRFNAVTASGQVLEQDSDGCAITEPALDLAAVLGQAGVAEGVVCWVVPAEDYDGLLLGIESTQVSGRIHIDLQ